MRSPRTMKIIKKIHKANENVQNALSTRVKYIGSEYPSDYLALKIEACLSGNYQEFQM